MGRTIKLSGAEPHRGVAALLLLGSLAGCSADPEGRNERGPGGSAGTGSGATPNSTTPGAMNGPACTAQTGGQRVVRRLARFEYDNTVQDLLGLSGQASERFAADTVVNGFSDNAAALVVTPLLGDQLYGSAERLAAEAVKNLSSLVPCDPATGDAACAERFVRDFGRRAFRRPLEDTEVARYTALHALGSADGGFAAGIELLLTALLQSPSFLYRSELGEEAPGGDYALGPYELAAELAYTLTGSTPDAALLDAAEQGALESPEQLEAQAERLIDSPRGREHLARFVTEWLEVERLASVPKDAAIFPEFDAAIRAAMSGELERFVSHVVFEGEGTLGALLTAPFSFVDAGLAQFYGVSVPAELDAAGFGRVEMPDPQRRGVLALGAVMTTHARPDSSSPVHRGKLVRERVMCQPLPPPPAGIVVQPPPVDPMLSVRERYAAHSANEPCQGCHKLIDPVGFGFEHFDGVGRYRAEDAGRAVDATGQILQSTVTDGEFNGVTELSALLAGSEEVARCFALQWMRFAYGVEENAQLACALQELQQGFVVSGGDLRELLLATTRTAHFRVRAAGEPGEIVPIDGPTVPEPVDTEPPPPPTGSALTVTRRVDSMWQTGRCETVSVRNDSDQSLVWSVELEVMGTLTDHWNCVSSGDTGTVTFTGADWNRSVMPAAAAEFGFCVAL